MHGLALILITYGMVMVGLIATQILGALSIVVINILFYFASYLLSIIWIYFYFTLNKDFITNNK